MLTMAYGIRHGFFLLVSAIFARKKKNEKNKKNNENRLVSFIVSLASQSPSLLTYRHYATTGTIEPKVCWTFWFNQFWITIKESSRSSFPQCVGRGCVCVSACVYKRCLRTSYPYIMRRSPCDGFTLWCWCAGKLNKVQTIRCYIYKYFIYVIM